MAGCVGLGFRRLAILDLSMAAHQPMVSDDGKLILVFNGEIFNYLELRRELQALGHRFRSTGDTEVLLHAYEEWGQDCLPRLNGMWAFVIYDERRNRIFGSRDRFGIKPLYYYRHRDCFLFGSEIKAILASGLYPNTPNWNVIAEFLLQGRLDESANTFYDGIHQVPPGTVFELDLEGCMNTWRYWSLDEIQVEETDHPVQSYADLFEDSVRLHMRSDVPVGVCLSGGLDSTSIICSAARLWNGSRQPLLAFSYNAKEFDESRYIADTIRQTGAQLISLRTDPVQLWDGLNRVLSFHDEPVHSMTALVGFELMGLAAANGVKVVLNGQGSDEVIAGYSNFFTDYWYTLLQNGDLRAAWQQIAQYGAAHGGNSAALFVGALRRLIQNQVCQYRAYQRAAYWTRQRAAKREQWFTRELSDHLYVEQDGPTDWTLDAKLKRAVELTPLPLFLRVEDRNSMAHSLEARLPFLDYRLVSLAFSLSVRWKMRGPWNKYVLREAMRQRIPESVRTRVDKMGFPVPAKGWFANALYERAQDLIASQDVRERGIYNLVEVRRDLESHRRGEIDVSSKLFNLVQMELWSQLGKSSSRHDVAAQRTTAEMTIH
jgi:asparagine synthase (glutamine-hydrolysing)